MKAVKYYRYGTPEVLQVAETEKPNPGSNEILVRIKSTTVTAADWRLRKADPFLARLFNGLLRPKRVNILGFELSGIVEETGSAVTKFKKGDAIFAYCGLKFGACAEFKCFGEDELIVKKPDELSFDEAASIPVGGATALKMLQKIQSVPGKRILVYGASGSVGTYSVQLAKHFGFHVTAVCSGQNSELVKSLGSDIVIDYTSQDITSTDNRYDAIIDAVGKLPLSLLKKLLLPKGQIVSVRGRYKIEQNDLNFLGQLAEKGILKPVIDRKYPLDKIIDAHRYAETWRKKGNIIITVS